MTLTKDYTTPLFDLMLDIVSTDGVDITLAIENMQPNNNTIALGFIIFLLAKGYTQEQITQRFIDNSHAK